MRKTKETAYAKINLSLDVLGRLDNGYHIVKMIMQTIDLYDELVFETQDRECSSMEITLMSDSGEIPGGEDNLIVRAVRRMEAKYGIRRDLKITLKKNIRRTYRWLPEWPAEALTRPLLFARSGTCSCRM